jgi:vitamin B12 transporter
MTALYIDGVRVETQDGASIGGGGAPWEMIPASQIERIEVLRGPASAVYGSDAMGGVVQIFTRRAEAGFSAYAEAGAGTFNQRKLNAGISAAQEGWDYALGLASDTSDGFNTRPDLAHTPDREAYEQRSASLRLGYHLSSGHKLEISSLGAELDSHYAPWAGGPDHAARGQMKASTLTWQAQWNDDFGTSVSLGQSLVAKADDTPYDYKTNLQSILWENRLRLAGGVLTGLVEERSDTFDAKASAFDPAFRGERIQDGYGIGYGIISARHSVQINIRDDKDAVSGDRQTGALAYAFEFAPHWKVSAAAGTAYRAPTLEQIYGPYGSPKLQAETNHSNEIGLGYGQPGNAIKMVVFDNQFTNLISSSATLTSCSAGFFCYYNIGEANISGTTVSGTWAYDHMNFRASVDSLNAKDGITGKFLSLRGRESASFGVDARLNIWQLGADVQAVGERFDDAANTTKLPGYALLNLRVSRDLARDWKFVARIDNAGDVPYQEVGHFATPGRTLYVGLQWRTN